MSRRTRFLTALPVALLLGACGSSHPASTTGTASVTTTSTTASASTSTTAATTSSTSRSTAASSGSQPATGTTAPPASAGGGSRGSGPAGGATNVRVPAAYVIRPGGKLNPPVVSVPAFLAVQLSVASGDGTGHTVLVKTPSPHRLAVPAHGRASVLIPGLRAGQYPIDVDGQAAGSLTIGGEPGP